MKQILTGTALFAALAIAAPVWAQAPYRPGQTGNIANELNRRELDRISGQGAARWRPYPRPGYARPGYSPQGYGYPPPHYYYPW